MDLTSILVIAAILAVVAFFVFNARARKGARIRLNDAADRMSTNIEKMEDDFEQLMAKMPAQRDAVTSVMARSTAAETALDDAEDLVADLKRKYVEGKANNAPETVLDTYADQWEAAKEDAAAKRIIAEELDREEEEAISALEETTAALEKFETDIERARAKSELTEAIQIATDARRQSEAIKSKISRSGEAGRAIDHELEKARADRELSKGSRAEREVEAFEKEMKTKSARAALDALTGGSEEAPADDSAE